MHIPSGLLVFFPRLVLSLYDSHDQGPRSSHTIQPYACGLSFENATDSTDTSIGILYDASSLITRTLGLAGTVPIRRLNDHYAMVIHVEIGSQNPRTHRMLLDTGGPMTYVSNFSQII